MRIKYLALSVIIFITCFSLSAQENRTDASGLKQGPWIKKYANGNILYQGAFKDDKPVGEFKRYYEDGTPKAVLSYDESGLKAGAVFFHPDGKRAAEGTYIDKKKEGVWKYYSAKTDGYMISMDHFLSDKRHGLSQKFYATGEVAETLCYVNGEKEGKWLQYYIDGKMCLKATYRNGQLNGKFLYCFPDGTPQAEGEYLSDRRNGRWKIYNEDGTLNKEIEYIKGKPADSSLDEKETIFLDELEKNKGKILDPEMTGNEQF